MIWGAHPYFWKHPNLFDGGELPFQETITYVIPWEVWKVIDSKVPAGKGNVSSLEGHNIYVSILGDLLRPVQH